MYVHVVVVVYVWFNHLKSSKTSIFTGRKLVMLCDA